MLALTCLILPFQAHERDIARGATGFDTLLPCHTYTHSEGLFDSSLLREPEIIHAFLSPHLFDRLKYLMGH